MTPRELSDLILLRECLEDGRCESMMLTWGFDKPGPHGTRYYKEFKMEHLRRSLIEGIQHAIDSREQ